MNLSITFLRQSEYQACKKQQKRLVAKIIVDTISSLDPRGRFLDLDMDTGCWVVITNEKAINKTCQALRDEQSGTKCSSITCKKNINERTKTFPIVSDSNNTERNKKLVTFQASTNIIESATPNVPGLNNSLAIEINSKPKISISNDTAKNLAIEEFFDNEKEKETSHPKCSNPFTKNEKRLSFNLSSFDNFAESNLRNQYHGKRKASAVDEENQHKDKTCKVNVSDRSSFHQKDTNSEGISCINNGCGVSKDNEYNYENFMASLDLDPQ